MKVGDIVKLKSGGLQMTVHIVHTYKEETVYSCVWMDRIGNAQRDAFGEHLLELVNE